ncbi:MAG: FecR domain-containing protein [Mangrovibacterium sp.]|nr:FecR domain-containing protein [Mangrovibacterium sp.]
MKDNLHRSILLGRFIGKYVTNSESPEDKEVLDDWMNERSENKALLNSINSNKELVKEYEIMDLFKRKAALERFKEKILLQSKTRALIRWRIAASIFVLVGVTGILYFLSGNFSEVSENTNLYTSVCTENGQRVTVVLPDSSIVWLNSGTTVSYPVNFSDQNRKIELKGQAFFQVTHKKSQPFLVQANGLVVKVLGTKFDVNAYSEEDEITVVLESGKIELTHQKLKSFSYTMKPGEKAALNLTDNGKMKVGTVDASVYSSWKDGKLVFRNSPMANVVEKLRRWYNVDIEITDREVYNSVYTGTIKNENYEEIFRLIAIACHVDCRIEHHHGKEAKPRIIISKR